MVLKAKQNFFIILLFFLFLVLFIIINNSSKSSESAITFKKKYDNLKSFVQQNLQDSEQYFSNPEKKTKIVFWHNFYPNEEKILKEDIIPEFQKKYPGIEVIPIHKGYWSQLLKSVSNALPVNKQPHLVLSYPDHIHFFSSSHKIVPLDIFIDIDEESKKNILGNSFLEQMKLKEEYDKQEHYYYLPFLKTTEVMFYDREIFKKIHKDFPELIEDNGKIKGQLTWEKLEEISQKIKKENFIPILVDSESNLFIVSVMQKQENKISVQYPKDKTKVKEFLENKNVHDIPIYFKKNFYDKGYLTTSQLSTITDNKDFFYKKRVAMFITSSRRVNSLYNDSENIEISQTPIFDPNKDISQRSNKGISQGSNINLFYSDKQDEMLASWLFLKKLTSSETYEYFFKKQSGISIVNSEVLDKLENIFPRASIKKEIEDLAEEIKKTESQDKKVELSKKLLQHKYIEFLYSLYTLEGEKREKPKFFENIFFENSGDLRICLKYLFNKVLSIDTDDNNKNILSEKTKYLFQKFSEIFINN